MSSKQIFSLVSVSLCLAGIMVLVSCGTNNQVISASNPTVTSRSATSLVTQASQMSDAKQQVRNWLKGIPCRPPCWQGIVPGQTLPAQALATIQQLPFASDVQTATEQFPSTRNVGEIYWKWKASGTSGGSVSYHLNSTVYRITVAYPSGFALQDVIDAYGQPSHIHASAYPSTDGPDIVYGLDIVYMAQGFALRLQGSNSVKPDDFGPDWSNFYVYFFEPGMKGFVAAWGNPSIEEALVPWRGMLSFDEYCVGEACNKSP